MKNRTSAELNFFQYWTKIIAESWKKSWEKWGMWGIILPALVSLLFTTITNWGKSLSEILGENWILYTLTFISLYVFTVGVFVLIEPVSLHNKQRKEIQNLQDNLENNKVNLEIKEYHYPSYGQARKVGISIENKDDNDLLPKIKIIGDITQTKRYYPDLDVDPIRLDNNNRVIDFKEKIDFKGFADISFVERQRDQIVLLLEKKLLLANTASVFQGVYFDWIFNFEVYGTINGKTFENGMYSISLHTDRNGDEVSLQIREIKKLTGKDEN